MRGIDVEGRAEYLEQQRRRVNAELRRSEEPYGESRRHRYCDDFGPSYGFASLGDFYRQNSEGFWFCHRRRKAG